MLGQAREIDMFIHNSLVKIQRNWSLISRRKIATWQGLLLIVFISGFFSALLWAGYKNIYTGILALPKEDKIVNVADVIYQDAKDNNYGPVYSDPVEITKLATLDTTAPAQITDLRALLIESASVTLAWTAPGDDGNTGTAFIYDIRYLDKDIKNDTDWNNAAQVLGEPIPQTAGAAENHTVTQLIPNNNYFFAIKTSDEASNESILSNVLKVKTLMDNKVKKVKLKFPKDFYDKNVKAVIMDYNTGNAVEEVKVKTSNREIDIILKSELNYGQYYIMIVPPYHLAVKLDVNLDAEEKIIIVDESKLLVGNLNDLDDIINSLDWDKMSEKWGTSQDNQDVDLNMDGLINTIDWSTMNKNWGVEGDCPKERVNECRTRN